jgi:predicted DsbA family dithiol-disulfide isomerase
MAPIVAAVLVEVWSDVVCPWCYIGKRRFEAALARFEGAAEVEIVYRPFQLDPTAPAGTTTSVVEAYSKKFGGEERARQLIDHVTAVAAESGLEFRLERARRANTLDAHRLLWFAAAHGCQGEVKEALLRAYFVDGENVADHDTLARIGTSAGLPADVVAGFLDSDAGIGEVRELLGRAAAAGITAVPTYVIDGKWSIPGAQDPDTFLGVLERLQDDGE